MQYDTDILIVGAGAIGLSFARALADSGLRLKLIERQPLASIQSPEHDGREIALTHHTVDLLKSLGQWAQIGDEHIFKLEQAKVVDGNSPFTLHFPTPTHANGREADTLGHFVSNCHLRRAAYEVVQSQENLDTQFDTSITQVARNSHHIAATLSTGETVRAKLLVAADGRFSKARQLLGISTDTHEFGRTVIVFRVKHSLTNEKIAFECFHYEQTLAVLPLDEYECSCVITLDSAKASDLMAMDDDALALDIMTRLNGRLGEMQVSGKRYLYPLIGVHARQFHAERAALLGDASVGMHPVTAHGYNLGMEGAEMLSNHIKHALKNGGDIADSRVLSAYTRKHSLKTRGLYHGTNFIVKLYANETPAAKVMRKAALHGANVFKPFKNIVARQLAG